MPLTGALWEVSKWDEASWGSEAGDEVIRSVAIGKKHGRDALIAATAVAVAEVLVSDDRRLCNRIKAANTELKVWSFDEFTAWLRNAASEG